MPIPFPVAQHVDNFMRSLNISGSLSALNLPATAFDPANPGPIGGTTPAAGTFTHLTVNQGTLTDPVTGLDLSATWDAPAAQMHALDFNITDTASSNPSNLLRGRVNGVNVLQIRKSGSIMSAALIQSDMNGVAFLLGNNNGSIRFGGLFGDLDILRNGTRTLQVGMTTATPNMFFVNGPASNSGNNNGGHITLRGGNPSGSGLRGNVALEGSNRSAYIASPSTTEIRDILISHGLMAAA